MVSAGADQAGDPTAVRTWPPDPGEPLSRILFFLFLCLVALLAVELGTAVFAVRPARGAGHPDALYILALDYAIFGLLVARLLRYRRWHWLRTLFRRCDASWYLAALVGVAALHVLADPLQSFTAILLGRDFEAWVRAYEGGYAYLSWTAGGPAQLLLALAVIALVIPIVEESLFRAILFGRLRRSHGFLPSALLSTAVFALLHFDPVIMPSVFLLGFLGAWLYERSGSLGPAVACHAAHNALFVLMTFFGDALA